MKSESALAVTSERFVQHVEPSREHEPGFRIERYGASFRGIFEMQLTGVAVSSARSRPRLENPTIPLWPTLMASQRLSLQYRFERNEIVVTGHGVAYGGDAAAALSNARALWSNVEVALAAIEHCVDFTFSASVVPPRESTRHCYRVVPLGVSIDASQGRGAGYLADTVPAGERLLISVPVDKATIAFSAGTIAAIRRFGGLDIRVFARPVALNQATTDTLSRMRDAAHRTGAIRYRGGAGGVISDSEAISWIIGGLELWRTSSEAVAIGCRVCAERPVPEALLTAIGQDIFADFVEVAVQDREARESLRCLDLRMARPVVSGPRLPLPSAEVLLRTGTPRVYPGQVTLQATDGICVGHTANARTLQPVTLPDRVRARHCYVLGSTGTGKSTLLRSMIQQDIARGAGVCLIDPHGDLYEQVLRSVPAHRLDSVVLVNPCSSARTVGINFLEIDAAAARGRVSFLANEVMSIMSHLYDLRATGGPVFEQYMINSLLLVMENQVTGGTLVDIPWIFEDDQYRRYLLDRCTNPHVVGFWREMAERAGGEISLNSMGPYITSKLNRFTTNAVLRPIIGQSSSTVDFRRCMDEGAIVLVNLSKGVLGDLDTRLLGMVIIGKLFAAGLDRIDQPEAERRQFHLYVDEAQNFVTGTMASMMAEARKFGLTLTLANQNLSQMQQGDSSVLDAIIANAGTFIMTRLGAKDAEWMTRLVEPEYRAADLRALPNFHAMVRLLADPALPPAFVMRTAGIEPTVESEEQAARRHIALMKAWRRCSRDIAEVEHALLMRREAAKLAERQRAVEAASRARAS